jgi:hypothetical protein
MYLAEVHSERHNESKKQYNLITPRQGAQTTGLNDSMNGLIKTCVPLFSASYDLSSFGSRGVGGKASGGVLAFEVELYSI